MSETTTTAEKRDEPKVPISIRLRRDTLDTYRASGAGWQTRLSADLDRLARRRRERER